MPAKIRLARYGKKAHAFYHIVVADSRAPRNGKFIEKIGTYNPNTNPATILLDDDKALSWLNKGAQPTDTTRAILSYKGVLYKNHLLRGVKKGLLTQEQADEKYALWLAQKEKTIADKKQKVVSSKTETIKARLTAEEKVKEERAKAIAAKVKPAETEVAPTVEVAATEGETPAQPE